MPIEDDLRYAMLHGGALDVQFDPALNARAPGSQQVYLHRIDAGTVRIDLVDSAGAEAATILWLPWKQGELTELQPYSIVTAPANTLFFTYYLSGCKVFAIQGGPVWHIDSMVTVDEFWPQIAGDDWVEEYWPEGATQNVAYIHRTPQDPDLWDLSAYLAGGAPTTYGAGHGGQAIVGGIVNGNRELDLYYKASPWQVLAFSHEKLTKKTKKTKKQY